MLLTNYHTHCHFCDGTQQPEDYVRAALDKGFSAVGFSSHAPLAFENQWTMKTEQTEAYINEIRCLQQKYQGDLEIYLGMELDYFSEAELRLFREFKLDYTLGSVHCIADRSLEKCYSIDGTQVEFEETLKMAFAGNIRKFVERYYELIRLMVKEEKPDIIGHFDVIKKNNQGELYFSENETWYRDSVHETLTEIAKAGLILEVNTGGILRGYTTELYPGNWILQEALQMKIPIMLNSDAHSPENLDGYFIEAREILKEIGYQEQRVLINRKWQDTPL